MSAPRWLPVAGVVLAAAAFTWLNRGERIVVNLGVLRLYRAPLTVVVLVAFLAGMLAMLALSLRHDRRVREELRRRGLLGAVPPPVEPGRPVSAWGVAREPARADVARAWPAPPRQDGAPPLAQTADASAVSRPHAEDGTRVHAGDEDRTVVHPRDEDGIRVHAGDEDRIAVRFRDDDRTVVHPREDDRRSADPRQDDESPG